MGVRDYRNIRTRDGVQRRYFCEACNVAGVLMRRQYSNDVWHVHLYCPKCKTELTGSIAKEQWMACGVKNKMSLPVYDERMFNKYDLVPHCPKCDGFPKFGKRGEGVFQEHIFFCPRCLYVFGKISDDLMVAWNKTFAELPDVEVLRLRAMFYEDYLQTDWWKRVSWAVKWLGGFRCALCGTKHDLQAHHNSYKRRGEERPEDLIVLCRDCHEKHHNINEEDEEYDGE